MTTTMMAPETSRSTRIGIEKDTRTTMVGLLNQILGDTFDLHSQVKQAHWNVRGIHFQTLHELFDDVAAALPDFVDDIAERIGQLGGPAHGTARAAAGSSRLPEMQKDFLSGAEAVETVADRLAQVANATRKGVDQAADAGDEITADLLTEITRALDEQLWFVESHLEG